MNTVPEKELCYSSITKHSFLILTELFLVRHIHIAVIHYFQRGTFAEQLWKKSTWTKQSGMPTKGVLHQENAPADTSVIAMAGVLDCDFELVNHCHYTARSTTDLCAGAFSTWNITLLSAFQAVFTKIFFCNYCFSQVASFKVLDCCPKWMSLRRTIHLVSEKLNVTHAVKMTLLCTWSKSSSWYIFKF